MDVSHLGKDFTEATNFIAIQSQKNLNNLNLNKRSNYLTVDASSLEMLHSPQILKGGTPGKVGLFSSLGHSDEALAAGDYTQASAIQIRKFADFSSISKKSLVSANDLKKNKEFAMVKEKYTGPQSTLVTEQRRLKEKLEEQREMVKKLKKKKLRTMQEL